MSHAIREASRGLLEADGVVEGHVQVAGIGEVRHAAWRPIRQAKTTGGVGRSRAGRVGQKMPPTIGTWGGSILGSDLVCFQEAGGGQNEDVRFCRLSPLMSFDMI